MPIQLFESEDHASTYVRARPSPPASLINAIVDFLDSGNLRNENGSWPKAVDVGAGSGQTTFLIKDYFDEILGVDISAAQIAEANKRNKYPNISFKVNTRSFRVLFSSPKPKLELIIRLRSRLMKLGPDVNIASESKPLLGT